MAARRTRSRSETYQLGHIKLYRDELEDIAVALTEAGDLIIKTGEWEMTEPIDLADNRELPEVLHHMTLTAHGVVTSADGTTVIGSVVDVVFSPTMARVTLLEPNTLTLGVLNRIQQVTTPHVRRWVPRFHLLRAVALTLLYRRGNVTSPLSKSGAVLINAYRTDRPTFWQRTRDDWIVGAVWAVVGVVLGGIVGGVIGYWVNTIT